MKKLYVFVLVLATLVGCSSSSSSQTTAKTFHDFLTRGYPGIPIQAESCEPQSAAVNGSVLCMGVFQVSGPSSVTARCPLDNQSGICMQILVGKDNPLPGQ